MKRLAFPFLGLVTLVVIALGIRVAREPRARLTIQAIGPTGQVSLWTNRAGKVEGDATWRFAVTNNGSVPVLWDITVVVKDDSGATHPYMVSGWEQSTDVLLPGRGTVLERAVPFQPDGKWSGFLNYNSLSAVSTAKPQFWFDRIPIPSVFSPNRGTHGHYDVWRPVSKAAPSAATTSGKPLNSQNSTDL
jgi:hypothetical protein